MLTRSLVVALVTVVASLAPGKGAQQGAFADRAPVVRTSVVTHGMRLTMDIPGVQTLPRSSLLRVGVRVTNVSGHDLWLPRLCDRSNPRAVVTNGHGIEVYTTIRTWPVAQRCVAGPTSRLVNGHSLERRNYVVLRGPVVLPVVDVLEGGRIVRVAGPGYRLAVSPQYLTPHVTALLVGGGRMPLKGGRGIVPLFRKRRIASLEIEARRPVDGPLVAIGSALCPGRPVLRPTWTALSRAYPVVHIPAPCPRPRLWSLEYGWVGQSVGDLLVGIGNLRPSTG